MTSELRKWAEAAALFVVVLFVAFLAGAVLGAGFGGFCWMAGCGR